MEHTCNPYDKSRHQAQNSEQRGVLLALQGIKVLAPFLAQAAPMQGMHRVALAGMVFNHISLRKPLADQVCGNCVVFL